MPFVLDASTTLSWHFDDENPDMTIAERAFLEGVAVPQHWFLEIASGLLRGERRGRTSAQAAEVFLARLDDLRTEIDSFAPERVAAILMPLARYHRLSVYDAAYLELAGRLGLGLATSDASLAAAANKVGVDLIKGEPS